MQNELKDKLAGRTAEQTAERTANELQIEPLTNNKARLAEKLE